MLFAHGFEGSPTGSKPTYMKEALGWDVTAPKMSELGWSIASQTEVLIRHLDGGQFDLVVGSSMGGLAAANASSMRPQAETRLLLIAPAFGLAENWEGMEETGRSAWKTTGERRYTGFELDIVLPWEFMESAEKMSWPNPAHPTAIMHGKYDEVVPISLSRKVAEGCENVSLHETDDSHRMKDSMRFIPEVVSELMKGLEISSVEITGTGGSHSPDDEDKLEVPAELSEEVSEIGDDGEVVESQADIEQLEAEMRKLEAEMEKKKAALESSKKEVLSEQMALEKEDLEEEKERMSIEASDAIIKAEEEVKLAKAEAEQAIKRAEQEEAEAEEARLIAEMEEDEAREAKIDADAAKKKLDEAFRKAEMAGKDAEQYTEEMEKEKREGLIIERVAKRGDSLDWATIGISEGNNPDDLTMINGIDEFTQKKLNALGIFTYSQISNIDSETSQEVNDSLELLPEKIVELAWTQQAITMLELKGVDKSSSKLEEDDAVIADLSAAQIKWAQIGEAGDRKSDDLTLIKGVDVETQKKLKVLGIRTFDQISKMDKETAEAVNGALGMASGRVSKMMWAEQAKTLIED